MYRQQNSLNDTKTAECPKCHSTRLIFSRGKLGCTNCSHVIGQTFNKYGAKRTTAQDGMTRDSKYEASVADELYTRKQAGDIKDYDSQYKVEMWACNHEGDPVLKVDHKIDFRIHHNDGSYELLEAKGVETADYKMRRKWLEAFWLPQHPDHTYTVIKQNLRSKR